MHRKSALFRQDASILIGSGHFMRCLTLADAMTLAGWHCTFLSRQLAPQLVERLQLQGHSHIAIETCQAPLRRSPRLDGLAHANWLPVSQDEDATDSLRALHAHGAQTPFDCLIVDHYALDHRWQTLMSDVARHCVVIDDLADRMHECDLLVDPNLGRKPEHYFGRLPAATPCMTGPRHALLRPEFAKAREHSLSRRTPRLPLRRGLISLGGVDAENHTEWVLTQLQRMPLPSSTQLTVVMGAQAPHLASVQRQARASRWHTELRVDVSNMAQLMQDSDWAVGAAGTSAWERCCMGLPAVTLILADNQRPGAQALANMGATIVPDTGHPDQEALAQHFDTAIHALLDKADQLSSVSAAICDGQGTHRVLQAVEGIVHVQ